MSLVLGISGTPRKGGNSDVIVKTVLSAAEKQGCETRFIRLSDLSFSPCIGCEKCRKDSVCRGFEDDMQDLYPLIRKASGLVMTSPTHNYNVTAWMKAFIDRLYCFYTFAPPSRRPGPWSSLLAGQGRKAVVGGVCEMHEKEGMGFTIEAMTCPLDALGFEVIKTLPVHGIFRRGEVKKDEQWMKALEEAGTLLAKSVPDKVEIPEAESC